jgi:Uma2 family endonuclease
MAPGPNNAHAFVEMEVAAALRPRAVAAGLFASGQFNLGEADDYRVPDGGYHRDRPTGARMTTAAVVVEILSPGDETYDKFGFYAAHGVEEIFVVDPATHSVEIWSIAPGSAHDASYAQGRSGLLDIDAGDLIATIDWP